MRQDGTVPVPRALLAGLLALLVVSLLTVAFLLGRESAGVREPAPVVTATSGSRQEQPDLRGTRQVEPAATRTRTVVVTQTVAPAPPPPAAAPVAPAPAPAPPPVVTPPPAVPAAPPADPAKAEWVRAYFAAMDATVGTAATWNDPEAMAQAALSQGSEGNPAGFDRLLAANREALQRMRAVSPPPECARHHALAVSVMERGMAMLERVRAATLAQDTAPLAALAAQGQELQKAVDDLAALERGLRAEYGLPPQ